ncbi:prepilin peptidase [Staphylococcus intermedius]|uniref:prepilin peptidase n=1 Tax=Staphylococcus intermedius TaxID=1285 RepID=UPI0015C7243C|nr:prepilin peptidase [Staphylococcus intermedius]
MIVALLFGGSILMSFLLQFADHPSLKLKYCFQRSKCETCHQELNLIDLIPIFSFCRLKGRCRHCQHQIPLSLLVGEVLGGLLMVYPLLMPVYIPLCTFYTMTILLLTIAIIDVQTQMIPHRYLALICILLVTLHPSFYLDVPHMLLWLTVFLLGCIQQNYIGMGDIKLFLVVIFFFPMSFLLLFLELIFPIGLLLLPISFVFKWIQQRRVPLAPAIFIAFFIVSTLYPRLISFYGGFL